MLNLELNCVLIFPITLNTQLDYVKVRYFHLLFSIFVEDLELFLQKDTHCGIRFSDIFLILLHFADDMVIIGKTPYEVQQHLKNLNTYCDT